VNRLNPRHQDRRAGSGTHTGNGCRDGTASRRPSIKRTFKIFEYDHRISDGGILCTQGKAGLSGGIRARLRNRIYSRATRCCWR